MFNKKNNYIIESNPTRNNIEEKKLKKVIDHIETNIKDGLTEEEIKILLDWTVENTRRNLEQYLGIGINDISLFGYCGFAQSSSLIPLEKYFKVTYNNTMDFPYVSEDIKHAFGTITFPQKTKQGIIQKQYLIDITLRQFFTKLMCENPKYQLDDNNFLIYFMHPGYFMCSQKFKTKKSIELAKQLLKKGYIELTDENLKIYIDSFIYSSITYNNPQMINDIQNIDVEEYKKRLKKSKPFEQEYDEETLRQNNCSLELNTKKYR